MHFFSIFLLAVPGCASKIFRYFFYRVTIKIFHFFFLFCWGNLLHEKLKIENIFLLRDKKKNSDIFLTKMFFFRFLFLCDIKNVLIFLSFLVQAGPGSIPTTCNTNNFKL